MFRILMSLSILFTSGLAFANGVTDCSEIDFRPQLPVNRSQGETNFCFAYSSAVLLSQRAGMDISALDLATNFYFTDPERLLLNKNPELIKYLSDHPDWRKEILESRESAEIYPSTSLDGKSVARPYFHSLAGGIEDITLLLANARGVCLERDFPSDEGLKSHQTKIDEFVKLAEMNAKSTPVITVDPRIHKFHPHFREPIADVFNTQWLAYARGSCKRSPLLFAALPESYYAAQSYEDLLDKLKKKEIQADQEALKLYRTLDQALERGRVAAAGYSLYSFTTWRDATDAFGDHSSAIVARKNVGGQCQYLVRDASGLECSEFYEPYRSRCSKGDFWVTRDELAKTLYSIVYLR